MAEPVAEHVAGQLDLDGRPVPPTEVAAPNPDRVWIDVTLNVSVRAADCWGGGEPERWDVRTLADEIQAQYGGDLAGFLRDWNLGYAAEVSISAGQRTVYLRDLT